MNFKFNKILGFIQSFVAIMALPAGFLLMLKPNGENLGMTVNVLDGTPFNDYFIPGLFLFLVIGLLHAIGAAITFKKSTYWRYFGFTPGILLVVWICIQVYFIGLIHFLQPLFFMIGMVEILLSYRFTTKV